MDVFDPYLIPGSKVLRNRLGLGTSKELAVAEADLTTARIIQLMHSEQDLLPQTRDFSELSAIHFHLFQDVYDWAGELRTIDMSREGGDFFAPVSGLEINLNHFSWQLKAANLSSVSQRSEFIVEIAKLYDVLNWIHPFREGNGRAQRHFWSRVAADAGWILDWRPILGELNEASRRAREDQDFELLHAVFEKVVRTPT